MVTHKHSTLSDDGVDDDDLMCIGSEQPHPGDESFLSRGSFGAASSPDRNNQPKTTWLFDDIAPLPQFSSVQVNDDEPLPETVPIPSQMQIIHHEATVTAIDRSRVDFSEPCSTALRSSPCNPNDMDHQWEFGDGESDDATRPSTSIQDNKATAPKSNPAKKTKKSPTKKQTKKDKAYNTRPRRKVVYVDDGDSSEESCDTDEDPEEQYIPSGQSPTAERAQRPAKKESPKTKSVKKSTKKASPKNKTSPSKDSDAAGSTDSTQDKKRKQRPKTPLPFDDETQQIRPGQPATPPVSEKRPKKRAKRAKRAKRTKRERSAPICLSSDSEREEDSIEVASDVVAESEVSFEPCASNEQVELRSNPQCEDNNVKPQIPGSPIHEAPQVNQEEGQDSDKEKAQNRSPRSAVHQISEDQVTEGRHDSNENVQQRSPKPSTQVPSAQVAEGRDDSTVADSTNSTQMTSPCVSERPKISPEIPALVQFLQAQPLPAQAFTPVEEPRNSVYSALQTQQECFGGLGILMSRHVSRKDEEVSHRLQDIHSRIRLHLETKEKDVDIIAATYRKNGVGCVNRIQARFSKERQELYRKLQENGNIFMKGLGTAKRTLRDGAKDRQKALKEMEKNAKKRRQTSLIEVGRINDVASQFHLEV